MAAARSTAASLTALFQRGAWAIAPPGRGPVRWSPELPPVQSVRTARGDFGIRILVGQGAGTPVLLLHGVTWSGALNFHALMGPLAAARTVVVMDHRGHGHGLPVDGDYDIGDLADDAVAVLGALGIPEVIVVGFSLGSLTALHIAIRHPERVAGLVLTAGSLVLRPTTPERLILVVVTRLLALFARLGAARSVGSRYFGLTRRNAGPAFQEAWPWIRQELRAHDPRATAPALRAALRHDVRPKLDLLRRIPTVAVVHERDIVIPAALQWEMARQLGAEVRTVDADHEAPLSHPDEYRAAVMSALAHIDLGKTYGRREVKS